MRTNSELRKAAVASLTGKWGSAGILMLLYYFITNGIPYVFVPNPYALMYSMSILIVPLLLCIALCPMQWGLAVAFLDVACGKKMDYGTLFDGYKDFVRIFLTSCCKAFTFFYGRCFSSSPAS